MSAAGAELFEFIKPFFDGIDIVAEKLRQDSSPQLRIAAPSIVLHDYVPELLQKLRPKFPAFRLYLYEAARADAERLLLSRDVDLAITLVEKKSRAGIEVQPLLELPLILLVQKKSGLARAEELWKRDKIEETLISFPRTDPVHAHFQRGLARFGVEWFCGIVVNSARLIKRYVASGYGIALAVAVPGFKPAPQLRALTGAERRLSRRRADHKHRARLSPREAWLSLAVCPLYCLFIGLHRISERAKSNLSTQTIRA